MPYLIQQVTCHIIVILCRLRYLHQHLLIWSVLPTHVKLCPAPALCLAHLFQSQLLLHQCLVLEITWT